MGDTFMSHDHGGISWPHPIHTQHGDIADFRSSNELKHIPVMEGI